MRSTAGLLARQISATSCALSLAVSIAYMSAVLKRAWGSFSSKLDTRTWVDGGGGEGLPLPHSAAALHTKHRDLRCTAGCQHPLRRKHSTCCTRTSNLSPRIPNSFLRCGDPEARTIRFCPSASRYWRIILFIGCHDPSATLAPLTKSHHNCYSQTPSSGETTPGKQQCVASSEPC